MKEHHKVLIITAVAIVLIWVIDAVYDSFPSRVPFLALLTNVTLHGPFLRILLSISFLVFGVIIARMLAAHALAEETLKNHATAIETSMDGIAITDRDGNYIYANLSYASINGYASADEVTGKTCKLIYRDEELERMRQIMEPSLQKSGRWRGELMAKRKNGSTYFQEASFTLLEEGGRVCIIRDITWRKRSDARLRRSERFLNTIFDSIRDPFCIFDHDFRIIRMNEAYALIKNRHADELIGRKCHEALYNNVAACEGCVVNKTFQSADPCAKEKLVVLDSGEEAWMDIYTYPILDEKGNVSHTIEYMRVVTDRKKSEDEKQRLIEELEHLSRTDGLTGLMNRRALTDSLAYEIDRADRYGSELSLVLCDIDSFKEINDNYGHDMGDRALQTISATLKTILRQTDIAGRHGGDEFMLILPETSVKGAENLAHKILEAVRGTELRARDGRPVRLSMSIGVSNLEAGIDTTDSFIKRTDDAMYASKQGGRNRISTVKPYPLFP